MLIFMAVIGFPLLGIALIPWVGAGHLSSQTRRNDKQIVVYPVKKKE